MCGLPDLCSSCPYEVPRIITDLEGVGGITGAAYIEPAVCHGCGSCAAECPAQAIQVRQGTDLQTLEKISALLLPIRTDMN